MKRTNPSRAHNLTPTEIVNWFRAKATLFENIADTVENTFTLLGTPSTVAALPDKDIAAFMEDGITVESIKEAMGNKAWRIVDLSSSMKVREEILRKHITRENGFEFAQRGWIRAASGGES